MANILVVEPDKLLGQTYASSLQAAGHHAVVCATAQSAIMAADHQLPDLVILELQLVEHSGIEFLYEFRSYSDWQSVPVLIHSQVPPNEFAANTQILSQQLGVHHYLYKPLTSLADLLKAVDAQLPVQA